jgi:hypothetical protein
MPFTTRASSKPDASLDPLSSMPCIALVPPALAALRDPELQRLRTTRKRHEASCPRLGSGEVGECLYVSADDPCQAPKSQAWSRYHAAKSHICRHLWAFSESFGVCQQLELELVADLLAVVARHPHIYQAEVSVLAFRSRPAQQLHTGSQQTEPEQSIVTSW